MLKLTDVYSYGLIFAGIIACTDFLRFIAGDSRATESTRQTVLELKKSDALLGVLSDALENLEDDTLEDSGLIADVLSATLRRNPSKRSLKKVLSALQGVQVAFPE